MSTIDELEARAENMKALEAAAMCALGDAMRELAVSLPDGSKLAVDFAQQARELELFAGGSSPGLWGGEVMRRFVRDWLKEMQAGLDAPLLGEDV
jgi:hypothetical protein